MPVPLQAAKNIELEPQYRSLKGRVSQNSGKIALYQTLSASPASIVGANAIIAYGMMKGHRISIADAAKVYLTAWCRCRIGWRVLRERCCQRALELLLPLQHPALDCWCQSGVRALEGAG